MHKDRTVYCHVENNRLEGKISFSFSSRIVVLGREVTEALWEQNDYKEMIYDQTACKKRFSVKSYIKDRSTRT